MEEYEIPVWDIYFASIVSMAHCHPGNGRSNGHATAPPKLTLEECAALAVDMIKIRRKVIYS